MGSKSKDACLTASCRPSLVIYQYKVTVLEGMRHMLLRHNEPVCRQCGLTMGWESSSLQVEVEGISSEACKAPFHDSCITMLTMMSAEMQQWELG